MSSALASTDRPLQDVHDAVFFDLDGVVYVGQHAVPGAVEAIEALTVPVAFLTNNASRAASVVADHLRSFGLTLDDDAVVTAAQVVADRILKDVGSGARVLVVGGAGMHRAIEHAGLTVVTSASDGPAAVVQGGVDDVRWSELAEASYAVAAGVPWYASNPDRTFPTPHGLAPGNGAMVLAVQAVTGGAPVVAGKPGRLIYDTARDRLRAQNPLMVGDRLDTDIDGAIAADVPSLMVLTGVNDLVDVFAAPVGHRPDFIAADLSGLAAVHAPVRVEGDRAVCADAVATACGGVVDVEGDPNDPATLRAAVQLAWTLRDTSDTIARPGGTLGA